MTDITLEQRARELLAAECWNFSPNEFPQRPVGCTVNTEAALRAIEAALRLSAGADSARLDALEALVDSQPDKALLLHHGQHGINGRYAGLGLSNTRRTLREAIDQDAPRHEPGEVERG